MRCYIETSFFYLHIKRIVTLEYYICLFVFILLSLAGAQFPGERGLVLVLDGDGQAHIGEMLLERDDVLVE